MNMMRSKPSSEEESSSTDSITSYSSSSSSENDVEFLLKHLTGKKKYKKLNDLIAEIVVSHFKKEERDKTELKETISTLEKELKELKSLLMTESVQSLGNKSMIVSQEDTDQVLSELEFYQESIPESKKTTNTSASFVVINKSDYAGSENNSLVTSPISEHYLTAEGFEVFNEQTVSSGVAGKTSSLTEPEEIKESPSPRLEPKPVSTDLQSSYSPLTTDHQDHSLMQGGISDSKTSNKIPTENSAGNLKQSSNSQVGIVRHSSHSSDQSPSYTSSLSSRTGQISVIAWGAPPVKPMWQMEQEAIRKANKSPSTESSTSGRIGSGVNNLSKPLFDAAAKQNNHNESQQGLSEAAEPRLQVQHSSSTLQNDLTKLNAQSVQGGNTTLTEASGAVPHTWGVGARPKSNNAVKDGTLLLPLIPNITIPPNVTSKEHSQAMGPSSPGQAEHMKSDISEPFLGRSAAVTLPPSTSEPISPMAPSVEKHTQLLSNPMDTLISGQMSYGLADKMSNDYKRVAVPSDEQSELVSQAHSMAVALESNNQTEISEMLYKFANSANQMQNKLLESQALIQRQQVKIQSLTQYSHVKELEQLRKENADLLDYINELRSKNKTNDSAEPSSPSREKVSSSSEVPVDQCYEKRVQVLEGINTKLFQANKEWAVRWEVFRQQRKDEKEDLESRLQVYVGEIEKLRQDFVSLERQLTDAVAARQEAYQKNLVLEQEKLNLLKKIESLKAETEELSRNKRHLEAEVATLKAEMLKVRGLDHKAHNTEELKAEINLLKQQLSVFHEDFQKEREDKRKAESKSEKTRKQMDTMKAEQVAKTKKWQAMIKAKDDDINQKAMQLAELQYQVDHLKIQLQKEKKIQAIPVKGAVTTAPQAQRTLSYPFTPNRVTTTTAQHAASSHRSPEHQPGAWECGACTFINFPEKRECELCNWEYDPNEAQAAVLTSGRSELHSRGILLNMGSDVPDVAMYGDIETDGPTS